jgi:hypothetical protein
MSEEHIWPEWMHPFLPKFKAPNKQEAYQTIRLGLLIAQSRRKVQQGHVYTKRLKLVCKRCNETWMDGIEEAVKPTMVPMLQGKRIRLRHADKVAVSIWIALKVMVTESEEPRDTVISQVDRTIFMKTGQIPKHLSIWIGHHNTQDWYRILASNVARQLNATGTGDWSPQEYTNDRHWN